MTHFLTEITGKVMNHTVVMKYNTAHSFVG